MTDAGDFAAADFFVLRTPLLSFDELLAWGELRDPSALESSVRTAFEQPVLREALYLASPDLSDASAVRGDKRERKSLLALVSYFERMASRPTPFGLLAGCTLGNVTERTSLELAEQRRYVRHTRLDMEYLVRFVAALEQDHALRPELVYRPSSSLYSAAGRLRYVESRLRGPSRSYHLVALDESRALETTLARARDGATVEALAATLVDDEVSLVEAQYFVHELIDAQLLVSDLEPAVTGPEPAAPLASRLAAAGATAPARALERALGSLAELDRDGLGAAPAAYRRVERLFDGMPAEPQPSCLFQLDLIKPGRATLGRPVVAEIARALAVLAKLAPARRDDPLARFCGAFRERYEDREVPLVEALDEESGIGFGETAPSESSPLLADADFGVVPAQVPDWQERDHLLLRWMVEAARERRTELELAPAELEALSPQRRSPLPATLEVVATVAAASQEELDRGRFRVLLRGASGAPAGQLLARFCHADEQLRARLEQQLRTEEAQRPDAVYAEIVHLPEGRVGNVLCRPLLRAYEIPYLGRSGAQPEAQLPVTDLLVSLAPDPAAEGGDRVVLRSMRLGREVIPRLTSAHNYRLRSLGLYRFLCHLQRQDGDGLGWSWGALGGAPFLPRVRSGRTVFARAQWNLAAAELAQLATGTEGVRIWRERVAAPRWLALVDGDNELVSDLDNPLSVGALLRHLRGRERATLVELFPAPNELCAFGPEGRFTHELVIPFVRVNERPRSAVPARSAERARRRFPPGSEWLYAKLYTGTGTADRVLLDLVEPVVRSAQASGAVQRWFFIRFFDPQAHLRLRLNGDPDLLARDVLPLLRELAEPRFDDGRLWRLQVDTYERELQRYGGDEGISLSEQLFYHDSEAVLGIIRTLSGEDGLEARWQLALYGVDRLLDDFGFGLERKCSWARRCRDGLARELVPNGEAKRFAGATFRARRAELEQLLEHARSQAHPLAPGIEQLDERSRRLTPLAEQLRTREQTLSRDLDSLVASYAHMHVNRLLRGAQRAEELLLYELLDRLYTSRFARAGL